MRKEKRNKYQEMKTSWKTQLNAGQHQEEWKEEWHRIDVSLLSGRLAHDRLIVEGQIGHSRYTQYRLKLSKLDTSRRRQAVLVPGGMVWVKRRKAAWPA
jgi:hypothetical protein